MTDGSRPSSKTAHALRHIEVERAGDEQGTLATFTTEQEPWFEVFPAGIRMTGLDAIAEFYHHQFHHVGPTMVLGKTYHRTWENDDSVAIELSVTLDADGGPRTHRYVAVIVASEHGVLGERFFASDEYVRALFGPAFKHFVPITDEA